MISPAGWRNIVFLTEITVLLGSMSELHVPRVMGIINCSPDSFFTGSRKLNVKAAFNSALSMIRDGAEILDIGGESSRPGSAGVDDDDQIARVIPVIREIRESSDILISVDTRSARVAEAALDAGAGIINDISALGADEAMAALAAEREVPVVLMHMKGTPATMQDNPQYTNPVKEIREELMQSAQRAMDAGIKKENIILDPGIGFGKRQEDNTALLGRMAEWKPDNYLLLVGVSRKSFLGRIMDTEKSRSEDYFRHHVNKNLSGKNHADDSESDECSRPGDRLTATIAAHAWCLNQGVDILRVHDVKEARQLIAVWEAFTWAS